MGGSFLRIGAALAASSFLAPTFCSVRTSRPGPGFATEYSHVPEIGQAHSADDIIAEEPYRIPPGEVADEDSNQRAVRGESQRRSQAYRRSSTSLLSSNQPATVQKLLLAALSAMGVISGVAAGANFMRRPRGDNDEAVQGRRAETPGGFSGASFPTSLVVGALTFMIIACSLAAPLDSAKQPQAPEEGRSSKAWQAASELLASSAAPPATISEEVTTARTPRTFYFPYKGKRFSFTIPVAAADSIGSKKLEELQKTLSRPPNVDKWKRHGVTERRWGEVSPDTAALGLFHLQDGRVHYLLIPRDVVNCPECVRNIHQLGEEVKEYERLLTDAGADQLAVVPPTSGLPPVEYRFTDTATTCTVGREWKDRSGGDKTGKSQVEFSVGDTKFEVQLSKAVEDALDGEESTDKTLLESLVDSLKNAPVHRQLQRNGGAHYGNPYSAVDWGSGGESISFETPFVDYSVKLPKGVAEKLKGAGNGGWGDLQALLKTALQEVQRASVRERMASRTL